MASLTSRRCTAPSLLGSSSRQPLLRKAAAPPARRHGCTPCRAATSTPEGGGGGDDLRAMAAQLNRMLEQPSITGRQLRELVVGKWGRTYDVRLQRRGNRMYLQVMWKFLEQKSFPLTEPEFMAQLDAVAEYLSDWGVVDYVRKAIAAANPRGPGYTGGGNARCISIPLDVDLSESRRGEWQ